MAATPESIAGAFDQKLNRSFAIQLSRIHIGQYGVPPISWTVKQCDLAS
jgi:hypothetical protein